MRIFAVSCDEGRAQRLLSAASPLGMEIVIVPSPLKDDPEVVRRGKVCFEEKTSYPTGVAATLGHIRAMQSFLETGDPIGIIIEDDVRFRKDFKEIVEILEKHHSEVDIISLGFVNMPSGKPDNIGGIPVITYVGVSNPWGAQCYTITREYATMFTELFSVDDISIPYANHFVTDWVIFDTALGCRRHTLTIPIAVEGPNELTIAGSTNKPNLWAIVSQDDFYM
jgi:GR25 family glycosyltransferase involved in LPS biosynthesis